MWKDVKILRILKTLFWSTKVVYIDFFNGLTVCLFKAVLAVCLKCESGLVLRNVMSIRNSDLKRDLFRLTTSVQSSEFWSSKDHPVLSLHHIHRKPKAIQWRGLPKSYSKRLSPPAASPMLFPQLCSSMWFNLG